MVAGAETILESSWTPRECDTYQDCAVHNGSGECKQTRAFRRLQMAYMIYVCISSLLLIFNLHTRSAGLQGSSLVTAATSISEAKSRISIGGHMDNAESWKQAAFVLHS